MKVSKTFNQALKNRNVAGYRFDNSQYWRKYYKDKLKNADISRERRYVDFIKTITTGNKVLDLASGIGFLPVEFGLSKYDVTCVDRYSSMIEQLKKYSKKKDVKLKIVKSDVTKLPFENNSFDLVCAMSIMEHLVIKEIENSFLLEIKRVCAKKGLILVHVPVKSCLTIFKQWLRKYIIKDLPLWAIDDDGDVTHREWFSVDEYTKILMNNGLKVNYVSYNFIRSNEKIWILKLLNYLFSRVDGRFYSFFESNFKKSVFKHVCISAVFICEKV